MKTMENIKKLMGSAWHEGLTLEEVNTFLAGKNYVDLKEGGYVAREKYDRVESEKKQIQTDLDSLRESTKDYETLKSENEGYKTEKANADLKAKVVGLGVNEKYFNYVKMDIDSKTLSLGEDEKANKAAVESYLKEHPEFASKPSVPAVHKTVTVSTNPALGASETKTEAERNATVNENLRASFGIGEK